MREQECVRFLHEILPRLGLRALPEGAHGLSPVVPDLPIFRAMR